MTTQIFSSLLALSLMTANLAMPSVAQAAEPTNTQLQKENDELRKSIEDLKHQSLLGTIKLDQANLTKIAGGAVSVAVMSWFANGIVEEIPGVGGRILGVVTVGGMVAGGTIAVVAGLAAALVPSPANAGEFSAAFTTKEGFQYIMSLDTENVMGLCAQDSALKSMIVSLDQNVKAIQSRN